MRRNNESRQISGLGSTIEAAIDQIVIIALQLARQIAYLEVPRTSRTDEGDLGGRARDEHLFEALQLIGPDRPLDDFDPATSGKIHYGLPSDPVEEAVRRRREQLSFL